MINSRSKPSHIIFVNYLDLDQAFATHKIRFGANLKSKPLYPKTQENSWLKTRYLKEITTE
jgi:hypothetical protein